MINACTTAQWYCLAQLLLVPTVYVFVLVKSYRYHATMVGMYLSTALEACVDCVVILHIHNILVVQSFSGVVCSSHYTSG